ncbi:hypothetical protein [Radiobacillus sp. PE A8.2]|uniref:hypothetical protein n=1 Tax=Radiobacillus sp. PE A8.2 TaxID=3380349 RepID=UPI00388FAEE3
MEDTLKQILNELQKVNQRMDGMENRMDGFDKRFDGNEKHMIGFQKRFDNIDKDLTELKIGQEQLKDSTINRVGPYIEAVAKHIDVRFDEVKETLEDQQRVIDTLAVRSVKHESEIKEIKQILNNQ